MNKGIRIIVAAGALALALVAGAQQPDQRVQDIFRGKLFPPNAILEHQDELALDREQYTAIRQAVVGAQADIAEFEWDLREAYQAMMAALDATPVDTDEVLDLVDTALKAENEVKKRQVRLLVELRNLLNEEQAARLRSLTAD